MAADEAATVAALDAARSVFYDYVGSEGGRVVDTAGDSVLAVFATATGAVRAALAIQRSLRDAETNVPEDRRMRFRIGVNLGEVMEKSDGSIYGAGVNVAARLESLAEPGSVMISEDVQRQAKDRLDAVFHDAGTHVVKNVPDPVRAYRVGSAGSALSPKTKQKRPLVAAASLLVLIAAGAVWWATREAPTPAMLAADGTPTNDPILAVPTGPSIAILPFENLGGDPDQSYFADGITQDIINQMSPTMGLQVTSRASSFRYRSPDIDLLAAGRELGVQFLVVGSVRRDENTIRVNVELIDVTSGQQFWTNSYDRDLTLG
jgi:adenylate cyclase